MTNASGHQGKQWQQKSEHEHIRHFLHKTYNVVMLNQRQRNLQKSVLHLQSCFFLLIGPTDFLAFLLPSPLSITRIVILFD